MYLLLVIVTMPGGDRRGSTKTNKKSHKKDTAIEETLTCDLCKQVFKDHNDKLLQCDRCDLWNCAKCKKYTDAEYKMVCEKKSLGFYCDRCEPAAKEAVRSDNIIEVKCKMFMDTMTDFITEVRGDWERRLQEKADKADVIKVQADVTGIKKDIAEIQESMKTDLGAKAESDEVEVLSDHIREMEDREQRKLNVIVYGAKESEDADPLTRKQQDEEFIKSIATTRHNHRCYSSRIGRKTGNANRAPRPLRITLADIRQKTKLLQTAPNLRNSENDVAKNLFFKRDMTAKEREQDSILREELKAKREKSTQEADEVAKWVIRRGKVANIGRYPEGGDE